MSMRVYRTLPHAWLVKDSIKWHGHPIQQKDSNGWIWQQLSPGVENFQEISKTSHGSSNWVLKNQQIIPRGPRKHVIPRPPRHEKAVFSLSSPSLLVQQGDRTVAQKSNHRSSPELPHSVFWRTNHQEIFASCSCHGVRSKNDTTDTLFYYGQLVPKLGLLYHGSLGLSHCC